MRKLVIFVFCLFTLIMVKADNVDFYLYCPKDEIKMNEKVNCELRVNSNIEISNITFDYDASLLLSFIENNNVVDINEQKVSVSYPDFLRSGNDLVVLKMEFKEEKIGSFSIFLNNIKVNNEIEINNISKEIRVQEEKILSSNNKLTDITIDGIFIDNFNPDVNRYEGIIVHKPVIFIDIKGNDSHATVTGVGSSFIREGKTSEINICVISEDGNMNIYTLSVTYIKKIVKSKDASLDTIELYNNDKRLDFVFDKEKDSFKIKIDSNIDKVLVKATLSNNKAFFIEGYEPKEVLLDYGDNIIELRTQSENGDTKIYIINVIRDDNRSNDNSLKEIFIEDNIKVELEKGKYEYNVFVDYAITKTKISVKANDKKTIVSYKDIILNEGNNEVIIKATSENGKVKEYRLNIFRDSLKLADKVESLLLEDKEIMLEKITIEGYSLNFNKDIHEYDLSIDENVSELSFKIEPIEMEKEISGNKDLQDGSKILLNIKNGKENMTYTFNIHKEEVKSNYYLVISLICLIIISIVLISLLKKRKK